MAPEAGRALNQQIWDLWVEPEIRRRREADNLPHDFHLFGFQVVISSPNDNGETVVRLNDEVRAIAKVQARRTFEAGQTVYANDIEAIEEIDLLEKEANCAHVTGLELNGNWVVHLDFRYNKKRAREHLGAAHEFFEEAAAARGDMRWRPFVDNLFSAAELIAKAELMLTPTGSLKELKDHGRIRGKYGSWSRLGNAPEPSGRALALLGDLRYQARYLENPLSMDEAEADRLLEAVRQALDWTDRRLRRTQSARHDGETDV